MLFFGFGLFFFFFHCRRFPDRFISSVRDLKRSPGSGRRTSCEEGEEKAERDGTDGSGALPSPVRRPLPDPPVGCGGGTASRDV